MYQWIFSNIAKWCLKINSNGALKPREKFIKTWSNGVLKMGQMKL
jgi:hypothetical protein